MSDTAVTTVADRTAFRRVVVKSDGLKGWTARTGKPASALTPPLAPSRGQ
jgi:hypothetical protein